MSCNPQCSWSCTNPTAAANCQPVCDPPSCTIQYTRNSNSQVMTEVPLGCDTTVNSYISCPDDACEMDECPSCETVSEAPALCEGFTSLVMCTSVNCQWDCQYPSIASVECELSCESPSCIAEGSYRPIAAVSTEDSDTTSVTYVGSEVVPTPMITAIQRTSVSDAWKVATVVLGVFLGLTMMLLLYFGLTA